MNKSIIRLAAISGCALAFIASSLVSANAQSGVSANAQSGKYQQYYHHQLQTRNTIDCSLANANCAIPANSHSCKTYTATAKADGLENTQNMVRDALFNLIARDGAQVSMTDTVHQPDCLYLEVGNRVRCDMEAVICK